MKLGVNTVDIFSGDHIALNVQPELDEFSLVEHVKRVHQELGVDVVELPANLMVICPNLFTERTIEALADYQSSSKVGYTVHLPFRGLDVSSLCRPIAEASVASYKQIIAQLEKTLTVEHYVMHLTEMMLKQVAPKPHLDSQTKEQIITVMYEQAEQGIREILKDIPKEKLLLENIKSGWQEPFAVARKLGTGICCDIGHLVLEEADITGVVEANLDLIKEFHFHDAVEWTLKGGKTVLQDHVALGTGVLDVPKTLDTMLSRGFDGVLMIEVGRWEAAQESVKVVREYLKNRS
ncbi:MAG: sugar phosphate isomerase/epimerase [Limnochordia bacterium]|nr:sugar phosphate isomerase/epimerase [Limnochordia bacterium]